MIRSVFAPRAALAAAVALALTACPHHDGLQGVGGRCSTKSSCRPELVCLSGTCATEAPASPTCNPATSAPTVSYGGVAGPADDPLTCVKGVQAAVSPTADRLGTFTVGTTTPAFTIPDGTVSFSIVSQAVNANEAVTFPSGGTTATIPNWPVPFRVTKPGGSVLYDDIRDFWASDPKQTPALEAFYAGIVPGVGAFTTPNTSRGLDVLYSAGKLQPGAWSAVVGDLAYECTVEPRLGCGAGGSTSGTYDVTVIPKAGPIASTGTLDLSIYFVSQSFRGVDVLETANGGTGTAAPEVRQGFAQLVASLQVVLRRLGVCLGQVKVYDVADWARTKYSNLLTADGGRCGELAQLSTLSRPDEAVHLFLVDGFDQPGLAGIDGSIAGPSGVPGTTTSGAAVGLGADLAFTGQCLPGDLDPAHCGPDSLAYVAAHEAGHWLGLFHTTESTGFSGNDPLWDPLDDTGTCSCACITDAVKRTQCTNGNQDLGTSFCVSPTNAACRGGDNLMFWIFSPGNSQGSVSPQQGRVARLNPAVH